MAHPNAEILRRGFEAFSQGDMATVGELTAEDAVWHQGGNNVLSGDYTGKEAIFGFFAKLAEETGGSVALDIHDIVANDEHTVGLITVSATRDGRSLEERVAEIYHIKDGQFIERWAFYEDQQALDDFFS